MPQLQRLECSERGFRSEAIHAFQLALRSNRTLKQLHVPLGDDGIRRIADALVGNTTIDALNITQNNITSAVLDNVTRMIESTQLKLFSE